MNHFILHVDSLSILDELSDDQAGKLFKLIKAYHQNIEIEIDIITKIAFIQFKTQFERDALKYNSICDRNRMNGIKGGRPNNPENTKTQITQSVILKPSETQDNPNNLKSKSKSKNNSKSNSKSNTIINPEIIDVENYFNENGYTKDSASKFFNYYNVANWHDSKGNIVQNWKQKAQSVWFKPENEVKKPLDKTLRKLSV